MLSWRRQAGPRRAARLSSLYRGSRFLHCLGNCYDAELLLSKAMLFKPVLLSPAAVIAQMKQSIIINVAPSTDRTSQTKVTTGCNGRYGHQGLEGDSAH